MMTEQTKQDDLKAAQSRRNKGAQFKTNDDDDDVGNDDGRETLGCCSLGKNIRQCFLGSLAFQLLSYVVLFSARSNNRPATEGICVDVNRTEFDCARRAAEGASEGDSGGGGSAGGRGQQLRVDLYWD